MPPILRHIEGKYGRIDIPNLGARVADIDGFHLTRRADEGPDAEFYDLRAVCSFVAAELFADDEYPKVVTIQLGKRSYRLEPNQGPEQRTVLIGRSLTMERVRLVAAQ